MDDVTWQTLRIRARQRGARREADEGDPFVDVLFKLRVNEKELLNRSRTVVVVVPSLAVRVVVVRSWSAPPSAPASILASDSNVRLAPARA